MELTLNIYDKKKVVKTYTADTYDVPFGVVEDLIELIDLDKLQTGADVELLKIAASVVMKGMGVIKPLLKDIFEGLTDEELRCTKVSELAAVLVKVVKSTIDEIGKGVTGKN